MKPAVSKHLRCAIYTRGSTEHGLEQEFNSLDNQREAAEAYIKSQAHEGWRCLRERYDDGGFSGGSMTVSVHPDRLELERMGDEEDERSIRVSWSLRSAQRRREIILPPGTTPKLRPMKVEDRTRILHAIATARTWLDEKLIAARVENTDAIAVRENCSERSVRMTLSLASLSPTIVRCGPRS